MCTTYQLSAKADPANLKADPALRHLPFLFYTATYTSPEDEAFARSLGADAFFTKPMEPADFRRGLRHPEHGRVITLQQMLGLYAWHGRHHVGHITSLKKREGW